MTIKEMIKALVPDFPEDRSIVESANRETWYKIDVNKHCMYVPQLKVLRFNMMELERFSEAVTNYAHSNGNESIWDWDNLNTEWAQTEEETLQVIDRLNKMQGYIACDIESRRLSFEDNRVLAIGFAYSDTDAIAISIFTPAVIEAMNRLFARSGINWIWHNGKFDTSRLNYLSGVHARVDEDTMLLHYSGINEKRGTHGLKDLAQLYLQAPAWEDELDRFKKKWCKDHKIKLEDFTYDLIPIEILIPYMMKDCIATRRLFFVLKKLANPDTEFVYRKLIKASNTYARIEMNGALVNCDYLPELTNTLVDQLEEANKHVDAVADELWDPMTYAAESGAKSVPREFNIKSPKQLKWMLEKSVGHSIKSTDKDALDELVEEIAEKEDTVGAQFIEALMTVRKCSKNLDTYASGIMKVMCADGRVRCTYNLHGTETGRLSSSDPNMQNIPRDKAIKNLFKAEDGYRLVQFDYSQAELRVLAVLSKEPFLEDVYLTGKDLHSTKAAEMFGPEYTKEQRTRVKTINFGVPFGVGAPMLAKDFKISMNEARDLIRRWFAPMPTLVKYLSQQRSDAQAGKDCRSLFGRHRHFVITNDNLYHVQNEFINMPIQSVASDCTVFSILELQEWIDTYHIDARIIITVHDSIVLEVKDDPMTIRKVVQAGKRIMASVPKKYIPDLRIPFCADAETGYTWGALKEYDESELIKK